MKNHAFLLCIMHKNCSVKYWFNCFKQQICEINRRNILTLFIFYSRIYVSLSAHSKNKKSVLQHMAVNVIQEEEL